MARTIDFLCQLTQPASQPSSQLATAPAIELSPGGTAFHVTLLAMGLCVLAVWIVRRMAGRRKLTLSGAPNRPNTLGIVHVAFLVLLMIAVESVFFFVIFPLQGSPAEGSTGYAKTLILTGLLAKIPLLAAILYVAKHGFQHGLENGLGLSTRHWIFDSLRGILGLLAIYPVCSLLGLLSMKFVPSQFQRVNFILEFLRTADVSAGWKVLAITTAVIAAPIFEEIFFRGIFQSALRRYPARRHVTATATNELPPTRLQRLRTTFLRVVHTLGVYLRRPWPAIVIVSLLFAAAHVDFKTFKGLGDVLPLFALSMALGYNYERCGRLWPSILMHTLFNGITIATILWP